MRKRRLKSLADCCRAGTWLWNQISENEIEPVVAGKLIFLLNTQRGIIQTIEELELKKREILDFEKRLKAVEDKLKITT